MPKVPPEVGPPTHNVVIPSSSSPSNSSLLPPSHLPPPSSSSPFSVLSLVEITPPPLLQANALKTSLPLLISSHPSLDPPPIRHTRSSSKEHGTTSDSKKKHGLGRNLAKQQRDENAQKDIAMGTQNPIESYILGKYDKEIVHKDQGGLAPLRTPHTQ